MIINIFIAIFEYSAALLIVSNNSNTNTMSKKSQKILKNGKSELIFEVDGTAKLEIDYEGIYTQQKKLEMLC
jgi:hypothetical protein